MKADSWRDFWKQLEDAVEPQLRRELERRGWKLRVLRDTRDYFAGNKPLYIAERDGYQAAQSFDPDRLLEQVDEAEASARSCY